VKSQWNESEAEGFKKSSLELRAYTSRLLGKDSNLVLHGGGNTSLKEKIINIFGEEEEILYVKGSGYDLKVIPPEGFSPARLETLNKLAKLPKLSDTDMVRELKAALIDPSAPTPSVEAILHAIIPFKYVDHTHADAVVTISNTENGEKRIKEIYGDNMLILPYCMPGFVLSKQVYEATLDLDWAKLDGIILLNHGVFTFDDDAKISYEKMITIVNKAESYLEKNGCFKSREDKDAQAIIEAEVVASYRKEVGLIIGQPIIAHLKTDSLSVGLSKRQDMQSIMSRGPVTPDHIIHTKRIPMFATGEVKKDIDLFSSDYQAYFERNKKPSLTCLDHAPRYAVWKNKGILIFGPNKKRVDVVSDITDHTIKCVQWAEALGGWKPLDEGNLFDVEYWELEQAKLKRGAGGSKLEGMVALVTGAASGIGKACALELLNEGACVVAIDINPDIEKMCSNSSYFGMVCDVTHTASIQKVILASIQKFGGLDILISNAGSFPKSSDLSRIDDESWTKAIEMNLTSHMRVLRESIPYLKHGFNPSVVIVASKNVPAPGPGASAYSSAKAGLTQMARVAALELAEHGIRVNVLHPNAVFDTGIWSEEVLNSRAKHYGTTVEGYKRSNLLKAEITSRDVAKAAVAFAGDLFMKTTGAQLPVDGGNERVI